MPRRYLHCRTFTLTLALIFAGGVAALASHHGAQAHPPATAGAHPPATAEAHPPATSDPAPAPQQRVLRVAPPPAALEGRIEDPAGVTHVPFELVNNHIHLDGAIDGKPVRFLVDTGGVNLLTPATAQRLGLAMEATGAVAGGAGAERVPVSRSRAGEIRVGAAVLSQPTFMVIDMGPFERIEGAPIDGLVGHEMFRRFGVQIDYERKVLTLSEPEKFTPPAGATALPFELNHGRIPLIEGRMDGLPLRLMVDTGARTSLTMHGPFAREHALDQRYAGGADTIIGWGVGGPVRGRPARFGALELGNLRIEGVIGNLFSGDRGAFSTSDISANLGGGVLRRFTVALDYRAQRMYLAPNASFARGDEYDRSGLWLMKEGDVLEIGDVAPQSAGERAGLKVGDRVVAIDGAPVASRPLGEWRRELRERAAGTNVRLAIERDGRGRDVTLALEDRVPTVADRVPRS